MQNSEENEVVQQFLDQVCRHIKVKKMHPEIREELTNHIEDRIEELQLRGSSKETAIHKAIEEMGSPDVIGKSMNETHKPVLNWRIALIVAIISLIGVIGAVSIDVSGSSPIPDLTARKTLQMGIGIILLVCFYFFDYQKLKKYSDQVFFLLLFMNAFILMNSPMINGVKGYVILGPFSINMLYSSVILLLLALAGMKPIKEMNWIHTILHTFYRGVIPLLILTYIGNSVLYGGIMYMTLYMMLMWLTKRNVKQFAIVTMIPTVALLYFTMPHFNTIKERFMQFLQPIEDNAYLQMKSMEAIRSAGWFGQGFASSNPGLGYVQSDSLFPYLIYCFGWIFGFITIILIGLFLGYLVQLLSKVKESYGRQLIFVVLFFFTIRFAWPILMSFGFLPFVGMELPFIGYGGTNQWLDLSAIGLVLSIYRRKNIIPTAEFASSHLSSSKS
ncbi:FtsW/RodA/SpoVE family cell cycle protein [Paenibacillus polygoni]|uniref:FtsW/RodA/SpoVE family cell cycle protein n=1 Tax=Paenibacillus polygoni TaxID=3050112 RepID=A0ABY8X294_9BACL|nr:FtsW/RodA/SpoVE family cell cycle protein [Paenibacillus polygoni]WIV17546.1 FtsW/RodA/SpoVE family cell cycle protein [Paenibacillus polygoni]